MADVSDPAIREAVSEVRDDSSETNWVAIGYKGKAELCVAGTGTGGHAELMEFLTDDKVAAGRSERAREGEDGDQEGKGSGKEGRKESGKGRKVFPLSLFLVLSFVWPSVPRRPRRVLRA